MAKLNTIKNQIGTVKEGQYTAHIIGISKADKMLFENEPVILKVKLTELDRTVQIFLNTKTENSGDLSIYDRTMFNIEEQLQIGDEHTWDTDDIEQMNALYQGKDVECYVVHNLATSGETYTNYYFSKESKKVKAMLAMA